MHYKQTTNKLFQSRLIKFAFIGIVFLVLLRLLSFIMTAWLVLIIQNLEQTEEFKMDALIRIADLLAIPVAGSIATIVTAIIARYGLRESSGNIASGMLKENETHIDYGGDLNNE